MSDELSEDRLEEVNGGAGERYVHYTVVCGDTIVKIAQRYRTSVQSIIDVNPIIMDGNELRVGWILLVPAHM